MCCEGTVVGLRLPEDGVNKLQNALKQKLICERRNTVYGTRVGR